MIDTPEGRAAPRRLDALVQPARPERAAPSSLRRTLLISAGVAIVLGGLAGLWLAPGMGDDDSPTAKPQAQVAAPAPAPAAVPRSYAATTAREPYRDPAPEQVSRALTRIRADYAAGGASAVARGARGCFEALAAAPGYAELDYCLAYDAYGTALMRRLAGGRPPQAGSWFGDTETRALQVARTVMGGEGDADARLLDIRRLTASVAERNPAIQRAEAAPLAPRPEPPVLQSASIPAPEPRIDEPREPPRVRERPPLVVAEAPPPRRREPRFEARPEPRIERAPPPIVFAEAPPRREPSTRPSFNCRYARTPSEQMVCGDPRLAAADRELDRVFAQRMAESPRPRALRAQQDRWLAAREAAAPDPRAVLDVYEMRIDELTGVY